MSTLEQAVKSCGLPTAHIENIKAFIVLFEKWNRSINLSAARDRERVVEHVIDSLQVIPYLATAGVTTVLDVGSGGGFPVAIAALCLPNVQFTSLEPVHKKHAFLRTAARELGLVNLEALAVRLEDHPADGYDAAMSRATFDLVEWLALGRAHVRAGGIVLGFEAIPRQDLPAGCERRPYVLAGKTRAIVALRRAGQSAGAASGVAT